MKIKVVTLFDEKFRLIGDISSRLMREYCGARGYEFACYNHLPDPSRGPQWNKTRIIQQELPSCDWLLWMDADTIPLNNNWSMEKLVEQVRDKDLIFSSDDVGMLCAGLFLIRNSAWSVQFLQTLWFCGQMDYNYAKRYHTSPQFDQVTIMALADNFPMVAERIAVLPKEFCANPRSDFYQNAFAMHYWSSDNHLERVAAKMRNFVESGWTPAAHQDIKIVTCSNAAMRSVLEMSLSHNQSAGYEVCVYDMNGELGFGTRFDAEMPPNDGKCVAERLRGRLPCKPEIIRDALLKQKCFLAWMDADAFAIRRFDEVNSGDYDIGVTMRRPHERGLTQWPSLYGFLNAGVAFFNHTPAALEFIDLWMRELDNSPSRSDQEALNLLVLQATDLTEYDKIFRLGNIRIKIFRTDEMNFYYWPEEVGEETKIIHIKTDRRAALDDWGSRDWKNKP